jgi:hypothetical protein
VLVHGVSINLLSVFVSVLVQISQLLRNATTNAVAISWKDQTEWSSLAKKKYFIDSNQIPFGDFSLKDN